MNKISKPQIVPPGGNYDYTQPETGVRFEGQRIEVVARKVASHRVAMGLPIGQFFEKEIEHDWCLRNPDLCEGEQPSEALPFKEKVKGFMREMKTWIAAGTPIVSDEELISRRAICAGSETTPRCPHYGGDKGFGIVSCQKCGCTGLKLFMATAHCQINKW